MKQRLIIYIYSQMFININGLLNFILVIVVVRCAEAEALDQYKDFLFEKTRLEGEWRQLEVQPKLGACEPCYYLLQIYSHQIKFTITNRDTFQYILEFQEPDETTFLNRQYTLTGINNQADLNLTVTPTDGIHYQFTIKLLDLGVYHIHEETKYTYILPVVAVLYILAYWIIFPLQSNAMKINLKEITERTNPLILIMYSLINVVILYYHLVLVVFFLMDYESYIGKLAFYSIFGSSFMVSIIQFGYSFASVQVLINSKLERQNLFKLIALLSIGALLVASPLGLAHLVKAFWFQVFFVMWIGVQGVLSIQKAELIAWRFILLFCLNILYLAILSTLYPILNFRPLSPFQILCLTIILFISVKTIHILLHNKLSRAGISELTSQKEDGSMWENPSQKNRNQSMMSQPDIKSDIELGNKL